MTNNGTGKGGKSFQDRELAARVRSLTMKRCEELLIKGEGVLYEAILLRLAGTVLPRLNEHSGPEGKPIPISDIFVGVGSWDGKDGNGRANDIQDNNGDEKDSEPQEEN